MRENCTRIGRNSGKTEGKRGESGKNRREPLTKQKKKSATRRRGFAVEWQKKGGKMNGWV